MNPAIRVAPLLVCLAMLLAGCTATQEQPPAPEPEPVPATEPAEPPPAEPAVVVAPAPEPPPVVDPASVEVSEPEPPPPPVVVCEPPPTAPQKPQLPATEIPILGEIETVGLEPPGLRLEARLDTGTAGSWLDARNVREFERDGKPWVRFVVIERDGGKEHEISRPVLRSSAAKGSNPRRYVVTLRTTLGGIDQFTEFSLVDRSSQRQPVLLGRNFLRDQALVDVSRRHIVPAAKP